MFKSKKHQTTAAPSDRGVVIEDISKQLIPITGSRKLAVVLHNVISPDECVRLIQRADESGFDHALVQDDRGRQVLRQDIRNCGRCIIDDASLADAGLSSVSMSTCTAWNRLSYPFSARVGAFSPVKTIAADTLRKRFLDMYLLSRKGAMENMLTGDDDHHNSRSIPWKHAMKKLHPIQM